AAAATLPRPAIAQGRVEWKMAMSWPVGTAGLGVSAARLADLMDKATDGRFKIRIYGAGELVPALQVFDAVSSGDVEMYHSSEYYYVGKHPSFAIFSAVPLGLSTVEHLAWLTQSDGQQL